jgi:hypothetical protein
VAAALAMMANHKAAGMDGMPMEFFKQTMTLSDDSDHLVNAIAPYLTCAFNCVLCGCVYPASWGEAALVHVPKPRQDPSVLDNYRCIAVGPALGKLFSMVMLCRMDEWAEGCGARAHGQAGFRRGRRTMDNVFVLRHLIDHRASEHRPLYAAFIDLHKAYDFVVCALLFKCLAGLGVGGDALSTLQGMHQHVVVVVTSFIIPVTPSGARDKPHTPFHVHGALCTHFHVHRACSASHAGCGRATWSFAAGRVAVCTWA